MEWAVFNHIHFLQQICQTANSSRFRGAFFAPDQNTAQSGVDEIQNQGQLHLLLSDDSGEGIVMLHHENTPLQVWQNKKTATTTINRCYGRIRATQKCLHPSTSWEKRRFASRSSDSHLRKISVVCSLPSFPVTGFHPKHNDLVHTAAVPSGNITRLSILPRSQGADGDTYEVYGFADIVQSASLFVNCQSIQQYLFPLDKGRI